ncbi:beta-lactamase family protein [Burkholderia thailandensis]|uniref:Beta-lactamase family protein n=1 Tax=Burkholderia thailandensis TaxID=57975 RepID=A0AAW9CYG2_BURTH|nr:serine hydrolase domain-containing protein [Burkholderia thailandensis]MCS3394958.1 beta-lactamase family protein [Burkholderia thailandensis]MCS6428340.1 beta-lactamase family protein [Burkholderia thailandensis]MCS6456244.1 beta-lactamase family protein [Burkholderia thailandensis]MCS6467481.1 beta-lactamase family protein [Burkholderia thailandensis]MCS6485951.1 beta-lactamase family protein [Burkholderia thailandensis]
MALSSLSALGERVDAALDAALAERRLVGAVVLVARRGELAYRRAAGLADREAGVPMREDALFRFASVSKPIVSAAAMRAVAAGKLDLDASIARWLPAFTPALADGRPARITARQLLSHTAGLGYRFLETHAHGPYARAGVSDGMDCAGISLAENLRRIASVPLLYAPGASWAYSLATDVLGALIEAVSDKPLADAVAELVTTPLGMVDTRFYAHDAARLAAAYVDASGAAAPGEPREPRRMAAFEIASPFPDTVGIRFEPARALDPHAFASGGAGMVGTASDALALIEALRTGGDGWLPAARIDEMARIQPGATDLPTAPGYGFGLGFSVLRDPAAAQSPESVGTWRWGGAYGHAWFVDRAAGLSVVALTNTAYEGMSGRFVADLRDAVCGAAVRERAA